jgi:hypothetical protein
MESQNRIKQKFKIKSECIESRDNWNNNYHNHSN